MDHRHSNHSELTGGHAPIPAPWNLKGRGFMFLFYFDGSSFSEKRNFHPVNSWGKYLGGLGALMLVDYESSNIGPYKEILFIPGRYHHEKHKAYSISRIWVSTEASVIHGQKNWGIPKNMAQFKIDRLHPREEVWQVFSESGEIFFNASIRYGRVPLPIHTKFAPLPLIQKWDHQYFLTKHHGFGWGRFAHLQKLEINPEVFPDIRNVKALVGVQIDPFKLHFPRATMLDINESVHQRTQLINFS